eukprot:678167-Pelagomonas_calceolata.AAC.5
MERTGVDVTGGLDGGHGAHRQQLNTHHARQGYSLRPESCNKMVSESGLSLPSFCSGPVPEQPADEPFLDVERSLHAGIGPRCSCATSPWTAAHAPPTLSQEFAAIIVNTVVHHTLRPDELRAMFTRYGDVRDCYMPRDYYTG